MTGPNWYNGYPIFLYKLEQSYEQLAERHISGGRSNIEDYSHQPIASATIGVAMRGALILVVCVMLLSLFISYEYNSIDFPYDGLQRDHGQTPENYIHTDRFLDVPERQRNRALELLGDQEVVPISSEQELTIFGSFDTTKMLERLARKVKKHIDEEERFLIQFENYNNQTERRRIAVETLDQDKRHADYLLSLRGKLKPYLVKLHARSRLGYLRGVLDQETLTITNQIFVDYEHYERAYPVIVYLEMQPSKVEECFTVVSPH